MTGSLTESLTYIAQSVPWALGGILLGFFLGRVIVAADAITDAAGHTPEGGTMPEADDPNSHPPARRRRFNSNTIIVTVIVALGLLTAVQAYVDGEETDRQTETNRRQTEANQRLSDCLAEFSNAIADALESRSTASSEAQKALDDLIFAVPSDTPSAAERAAAKKAFNDYKTKRANALKAQAAHPFPPAPRDVCQDAG